MPDIFTPRTPENQGQRPEKKESTPSYEGVDIKLLEAAQEDLEEQIKSTQEELKKLQDDKTSTVRSLAQGILEEKKKENPELAGLINAGLVDTSNPDIQKTAEERYTAEVNLLKKELSGMQSNLQQIQDAFPIDPAGVARDTQEATKKLQENISGTPAKVQLVRALGGEKVYSQRLAEEAGLNRTHQIRLDIISYKDNLDARFNEHNSDSAASWLIDKTGDWVPDISGLDTIKDNLYNEDRDDIEKILNEFTRVLQIEEEIPMKIEIDGDVILFGSKAERDLYIKEFIDTMKETEQYFASEGFIGDLNQLPGIIGIDINKLNLLPSDLLGDHSGEMGLFIFMLLGMMLKNKNLPPYLRKIIDILEIPPTDTWDKPGSKMSKVPRRVLSMIYKTSLIPPRILLAANDVRLARREASTLRSNGDKKTGLWKILVAGNNTEKLETNSSDVNGYFQSAEQYINTEYKNDRAERRTRLQTLKNYKEAVEKRKEIQKSELLINLQSIAQTGKKAGWLRDLRFSGDAEQLLQNTTSEVTADTRYPENEKYSNSPYDYEGETIRNIINEIQSEKWYKNLPESIRNEINSILTLNGGKYDSINTPLDRLAYLINPQTNTQIGTIVSDLESRAGSISDTNPKADIEKILRNIDSSDFDQLDEKLERKKKNLKGSDQKVVQDMIDELHKQVPPLDEAIKKHESFISSGIIDKREEKIKEISEQQDAIKELKLLLADIEKAEQHISVGKKPKDIPITTRMTPDLISQIQSGITPLVSSELKIAISNLQSNLQTTVSRLGVTERSANILNNMKNKLEISLLYGNYDTAVSSSLSLNSAKIGDVISNVLTKVPKPGPKIETSDIREVIQELEDIVTEGKSAILPKTKEAARKKAEVLLRELGKYSNSTPLSFKGAMAACDLYSIELNNNLSSHDPAISPEKFTDSIYEKIVERKATGSRRGKK